MKKVFTMLLEEKYLVSICVPIYKVEGYIERCARSLFEQTYENIEYVFVDDCSPDHSITILQQTTELYPHRKTQIRIVRHEKNEGLGKARNTGVSEAKGDFILHVDSDDYIDTNVVERLVEKQKETRAEIVIYPKKILYKKSFQVEQVRDYNSPRDFLEDILARKTAGNVCGVLIKSSLYKENGIMVEYGVNQSEDFQVLPRLLYCSKKIASINDSYYFYDRTNETSYSSNMSIKSYEQILNTLKVLYDFFKEKGEQSLWELLNTGSMISLCREKTRFAKHNNRQMYDYICFLMDSYKNSWVFKLPYKYLLLIKVKNYFIYRLMVIMLK